MMNLNSFNPLNLEALDRVQLMNRIDLKFYFHISKLREILELLSVDYKVLEIHNKRVFTYQTLYFDTDNDALYKAHHNQHLNRLKIRKRWYVDTNTNFTELKFKTNKGKTEKKRLKGSYNTDFSAIEKEFIQSNTALRTIDLKPTLYNHFKRITLVNKTFNERCTIDTQLTFQRDQNTTVLNKLAIVELKIKDKQAMKSSKVLEVMDTNHISSKGFSKYCIGRLLTTENLKYNAFKEHLLQLKKIQNYNL